jgi:peptide/nickel transport system permease protein
MAQAPTARQEAGLPASRLAGIVARHPSLLIGGIITATFVFAGVVARFLAPYSYEQQDLLNTLQPPLSPGHLLGTDDFGRDLLSRVMYGMGNSLQVAVAITSASLGVGTVVGALAGYFGGALDYVLSAVVDFAWGFPIVLIAVVAYGIIGPGLPAVMIAVGAVNWAGCARIVRGDVLALREKEFVEAARALGHGWLRIITRHILPHTLPAVLVIGSFYMAIAILAEAALSYIGLGVQPPAPSLGQMLVDGRQFMQQSHWVATIPGLAILLMVVGFNLLGDGLRDILDPQLKEF